MPWVYTIPMLVAFLAAYALASRYDHHMFQLNAYKPRVQLLWQRRNFLSGYLPRHGLALGALLAVFLSPTPAFWGLICFTWQAWLAKPREAKKSLVVTARVMRLMATNLVLVAATLILSLCLGGLWPTTISALLLLAAPLIMLLANALNSPLEKAINQWYINDAKRILAGRPDLIVIGVTGSYGKTSTKHFLTKLLASKYNVLMTPESYNTTLGVVRTIRDQLKPIHQIFICEMGARDTGHIKEICDLVHPRHGVITSIGPQHLETFKTQENIINTKFELAEALPGDGVAFLNYDNEFIRDRGYVRKKITYGSSFEGCDYRATEVRVSSRGSTFSALLADGAARTFETRLIGAPNVENLIGAIAVADYLGVPADDLAISIRRLESVPHRLQLINRGQTLIIDDAFNSNQNGAKAALEALALFDGYKILATPGMVELGSAQDHYNHQFGVQAASICDFVILAGARQTRSIREGLMSAGYPEERIFVAESLAQIFEKINALDSGGRQKVVLLENDLPDNY